MGQSPTEKPFKRGLLLQNSRSQHACAGEGFLWLSENPSVFSQLMPEPSSGRALSRLGWIGLPSRVSCNNGICFPLELYKYLDIFPGTDKWLLPTSGRVSLPARFLKRFVANPHHCIWQPRRQQWVQWCLWSSSSRGSIDLFNNWHQQKTRRK